MTEYKVELFYNLAMKELGLTGFFDELSDGDKQSVINKATELMNDYMQVVESKKQLEQNKKEAINFIVAGKPVPTLLKNKIESTGEVYDFAFDFTKDKKEKYERTTLVETGTINIGSEGAIFSGNEYFTFSNKPVTKNKSFEIKTTMKIGEVQNGNYVLCDGGSSTDKALHIGFRSNKIFTAAFYGDDMDVTVEQVAGKTYDIEFVFNASNKKGVLTVNDEVFEHTFKAKYQDNISYIGRGVSASSKFKGTIKDLKILIK
jgi:hypothetical protein